MATTKKAKSKKAPAKKAAVKKAAVKKAAVKKAPGKAGAKVKSSTKFVTIGDVQIELERRGKGKPILLLPSEESLEPEAAFVDELARKFEVIIPQAPGYGR